MKIFLMRHAEAVSPHEWRKGDSLRPLSSRGQSAVQWALPQIQKAGMGIQTIFCSPFVRAQETAKAIIGAFPSAKLMTESGLSSGVRADSYKSILLKSQLPPFFLFVGHNPEISIFASQCAGVARLLDDQMFEPGEMMALETGPIETNWMGGEILWRKPIKDWTIQS